MVSGKQLLGLINDVLDMPKIESGKMTLKVENLSLRDAIEGLCDIVRPQFVAHRQEFDVWVSSILSEHVFCDGVRLNQVLLNFLSNAMKFTPAGGRIDVHLWQEPSLRGEGWVCTHFAVKDTGMGMTEEYQKKLFTAFEREDSRRVHCTQGMGLGLTITKFIVDAMGGAIDVEGAPGKGTCFHVAIDFERVPGFADDIRLHPWSVLVAAGSEAVREGAPGARRQAPDLHGRRWRRRDGGPGPRGRRGLLCRDRRREDAGHGRRPDGREDTRGGRRHRLPDCGLRLERDRSGSQCGRRHRLHPQAVLQVHAPRRLEPARRRSFPGGPARRGRFPLP